MPLPLHIIDAFTDAPFRGNPAAVCLLRESRPGGWMQALAAEMNLSETAFLLRQDDGYHLRWFTPKVEVKLCGHATLASAHFLWEQGHLEPQATARFHTLSGLLTATRGRDGSITLDFPATPADPAPAPPGLLEALGVGSAEVFRNGFDYLVVVDTAAAVRRLTPDMERLRGVEARGVIVTAPGDTPGVHFVSRFFGPAVGVPEDPVTGSAHCTLCPYWVKRLGRNPLVGYQASPRGGTVRVDLQGNRVRLTGRAVTVLRGAVEGDQP